MDEFSISALSLPIDTESVFNRILVLGWYDGITSGMVEHAGSSAEFQFDLVAWGSCQEQRVFAFSPLAPGCFERAVVAMSRFADPSWPTWHAAWPSSPADADLLRQELDRILSSASKPGFVVETDSMFRRISAARELLEIPTGLLPEHFDGYPHLDNYDYWHQFLRVTR